MKRLLFALSLARRTGHSVNPQPFDWLYLPRSLLLTIAFSKRYLCVGLCRTLGEKAVPPHRGGGGRAAQACPCSQMAVQLLSTGSNAGTDAANAADEEDETRVPRPVVPWVEYDIVRGWQLVDNALRNFAMDCDCWPLVCRGGHANNFGITYRMQCGYCNSIHCPWQCRIFIHFNQNHAATL
jgi:hypothetical protein